MRFHLLKEYPLRFTLSRRHWVEHRGQPGLSLRGFLFPKGSQEDESYAGQGTDQEIPWKVYPVGEGVGEEVKCAMIEGLLRKDLETKTFSEDLEKAWDQEFYLRVDNVFSQDLCGQLIGNLKMEAMVKHSVLNALCDISDGDAKVQVDIVSRETKQDGGDKLGSKISTGDVSVTKVDNGFSFCEDLDVAIPWDFLRKRVNTGVDTLVTISVSVPDGVLSGSYKRQTKVPKIVSTGQEILEAQVLTDVTLVTKTGSRIEAHKAFLAAKSPVFLAMFQTQMREARENVVELEDMSEESVKALLKYVYYGDTQDLEESSLLTYDLFSAAHKYGIGCLERKMRKLLLEQGNNWFEVGAAVKLFSFARSLSPPDNALKVKAVQVLKRFADNLAESADCQELLKKDPEATLELLRYALLA